MRKTFEALVERAPFAHTIRITNEDIEQVDLGALLDTQGLFYAKRIVVFDNTLTEKSAQKKMIPHLKTMAKSEHVFLVLEEDPSADVRKQLIAHATKSDMRDTHDNEKESFADWNAANALEARNGKKLWLALTKAALQGTAPEMMHGQLFWKAKQMLLEKRFRSWDASAAKKLVGQLAELPHEARRKGIELEYALEKFSLEI